MNFEDPFRNAPQESPEDQRDRVNRVSPEHTPEIKETKDIPGAMRAFYEENKWAQKEIERLYKKPTRRAAKTRTITI